MQQKNIGHLVICRRVGECIKIGDGIEIEVKEISRGKVRIEIRADKSIPIFRMRGSHETGTEMAMGDARLLLDVGRNLGHDKKAKTFW